MIHVLCSVVILPLLLSHLWLRLETDHYYVFVPGSVMTKAPRAFPFPPDSIFRYCVCVCVCVCVS